MRNKVFCVGAAFCATAFLPQSVFAAETPRAAVQESAASSQAETPAVPAKTIGRAQAAAEEPKSEEKNAGGEAAASGKFPRFVLHGNFRTFYADAHVHLPRLGEYRKISQVNRRLQLYPSVALNKDWSLVGMLEDTRYDRQSGEDHVDDNHLYLDRLFFKRETEHTRLVLGRDNIWPIEGNVFDLIVEGAHYEFGNAAREGHVDLFAGRTVGWSSRLNEDRKNGVYASYLKAWPTKWQTGLYYYDFHRDDDEISVPQNPFAPDFLTHYLKYQITYDRQRLGELYLKYSFDRHKSLEYEGIYGRAEADADDWGDTRTGSIVTLRLRQQPFDMEKVGDWGLWISYYDLPRATYIWPTIDPDVTIFGREGFQGLGTRLDAVLSRGLLLQLMYYNIKSHDDNVQLYGIRPFQNEKERILAVCIRQFF